MKKSFKNNFILFIVVALFLFTFLLVKYREGVAGEWITPGYDNKDGYYNEHKISGIPEIDAIKFNHRSEPKTYINSDNTSIYQIPSAQFQLPSTSVTTNPVTQLTTEMWNNNIRESTINPYILNPMIYSSNQPSVPSQTSNPTQKKIRRRRRKKVN